MNMIDRELERYEIEALDWPPLSGPGGMLV
jgi:hypothetical protein